MTPLLAASTPPAGGAELGQVAAATALGMVATVILLVLVAGHRTGRIPLFSRLAGIAERVSGIRGWAALPGTVLIISLLIAVYGMYWDVSIHLDQGRDPGPLANGAHWFILVGLFGVLFAGVMAIALPLKDAGHAQVTLPNGWKAPVGGLIIAACGAFSLTAFPLDDVWHRLFGQDVTLWGPTHLMLIGGAALSVLGAWMLQVEGLGGRLTRQVESASRWTRAREFVFAGSFLVGMSTFQDEFDMGVPQFRLVLHPVLLAVAAGVVLVAARIRLGRGGALGTMAAFIGVRLALSVIVGPVLGHTQPHLPLYLGAAIAVELIGLLYDAEKRPLAFGALAGLGIGTLGLASEWGWSHVWVVIPWPSSLLPEAILLALPAAVGAGVIGGFIGRALTPTIERAPSPRWAVPTAALAVVVVLGIGLQMPNPDEPIRASVTTRDVKPPPNREIAATIRLEPANAADDAEWLNVTGWQGGGSVIDPLRRVGPGTYVTTKPIPVHGNWKTTLRLQRGASVLGLPIFLPEDRAIPVAEIPASASFTRTFVFDKKNLQREQKTDVAGWLTTAAYLAVLLLALSLIAAIAVGLRRVERANGGSGQPPPRRAEKTTAAGGRVAPA